MKHRFQSLLDLELPPWILNPFEADTEDVARSSVEGELLELKNDFELKPLFTKENYQRLWMQAAIQNKFLTLWEEMKLFFIAFPTSN